MTMNECAPVLGRDGGVMSVHTDADFQAMLQAAHSLGDLAEMLGLSIRQIQNHVDDGSLVAVNLGRGNVRKDLRVLDADLQGFLVRRRTSAPKARSFETPEPSRPKPLSARPKFSEIRAARKARLSL